MADTQIFVALNIGSQRISAAVFETSKKGDLILKGYESDAITADPAFESGREAEVQVALEGIVKKLKIQKSKVRYAISAQAVFMRFVKLPPIQGDNIEQLVTFEAQQHVPFPINEVVWDYELIEGGEDKEVVIVAIKSEALEEINDTVNNSGLDTAEVDVAPMALYNSFRGAYGIPTEPTLIVDIGAKTSSLLYVEGKRFFTRNVPMGGASITSAIAKEYNISFAEAELQKTSNGLVALGGGHTDALDESVAALAMVIRNTLTRLAADIARTTNYYRSQQGGSAPKKVLLAGGGANLPYTLEFLNEKLNLPVEFFNPLTQVAISKNVNTDILQRDAHMMGELVGLGMRGIGKSCINIDLVPEVVEFTRATDRRKPFLVAAAAILILGFAAWAVMKNLAASKAEDELLRITDVSDKLAPYDREIRGLLKKEEALVSVAQTYTDIEMDHAYWFDLLGEIRGAFASDSVWLTELSPLFSFNPNDLDDIEYVVSNDFTNPQSGNQTSINIPVIAKDEKPQGGNSGRRNQKETATSQNMAKAILIRGFWRENDRSQNVVSDLLKNLRENSKSFVFTTEDEEGKRIKLSDEQLLKVSVSGEEGDLGFSFELFLPLAKPVAAK